METQTSQFERFETFIHANKTDSKGRQIGYIVILADNGVEFYANVQKGVALKKGDFAAFGATQKGKKFKTHAAAKSWAYTTAKQRIADLK